MSLLHRSNDRGPLGEASRVGRRRERLGLSRPPITQPFDYKNHKFYTILKDLAQLTFSWYLPGARRHEDSPVEEEDDDERHVERGHGGEQLVAQVLARLQQQYGHSASDV